VPHVIGEACIGTTDQSCVAVCPVDCIHDSGHNLYVIDPGECIDCGACIEECPVGAISTDEDSRPGWQPFAAINAAWASDGPDAAGELLRAYLDGRAEHAGT